MWLKMCAEELVEEWDYIARRPSYSPDSRWTAAGEMVADNPHVRFFTDNNNKEDRCVAKILVGVRRARKMREIRILEVLRDVDNIISLLGVVRVAVDANGEEIQEQPWRVRRLKKTAALIFPFVVFVPFDEFYLRHEDIDKRTYLYELLLALDGAHAKGIMHRDLNPKNVLFNPADKYLRLIGWNCAEFYLDRQLYRSDIGNIEYRAPELLLGRQRYNYAVDMWSFGCIFATLLLQTRVSFFSDRSGAPITNADDRTPAQQLTSIIEVLGKANLKEFLDDHLIECPISGSAWDQLPSESQLARYMREDVSLEGFDLLEKCLKYDPGRRITAAEAKKHPYFKAIEENGRDHLRKTSVRWEVTEATKKRRFGTSRTLTELTPGDRN